MGKPEAEVEKYLVRRVKECGGLIRKMRWIAQAGAPDRFVAVYGRIALVECKAFGEVPTGAQAQEIAMLRKHFVPVFVIDSRDRVDNFLLQMKELSHA